MAYQSIGVGLRETRVGLNLTIADIEHETRISSRFLEAIESDQFDNLPGHIFARNFVRQYAIALGLDPEPFLAELPRNDTVQLPDPPPRSPYRAERPIHSAVSSGLWLLLAAGASTAAYLHFNHSQAQPPAPQVTTSVAAAAPSQAPAPAQAPAADQQTAAAVQPTPAPPVQDVAQPTASAPATAVTEPSVKVVITATESAWVQIIADGKTEFTGTLSPGETKQVFADAQVKMIVGNAAGLSVSLNGKTLEPLGPEGQVRVVRLTAEGPEFLVQAPPPDPDPL